MDAQSQANWNAASSALDNASSIIASDNLNRKTQKFAVDRYNAQRADSLSDWNRINDYNSPEAQMRRLKNAGLNPNLVYDNGASMVAAQQIKSSDTPAWNPSLPKIAPGTAAQEGLSRYYNAQIQQAQTDNLRAQNNLIASQTQAENAKIANINANTANTLQNTTGSAYDLSQRQRLSDISYESAIASLNKTITDTGIALNANDRANILMPGQLQLQIENALTQQKSRAKSDAEIREINQRIENMKKDLDLKKLEFTQREGNISQNDPWYVKLITKIAGKYGISIDDIPKQKIEPKKSWFQQAFPNSPFNDYKPGGNR